MPTTTPTRLLSLQASNIKSLRQIHINFDQREHTIAGANGQGKTASFDSIRACFQGLDPELVRNGEDSAEIILNLSNYIVRRAHANGSETLMVTDANGFPVAKAKDVLRAIVNAITFDPIGFAKLGGGDSRGLKDRLRKQRSMLIEALPLVVTRAEIEQAVADLGPDHIQVVSALGEDLSRVNLDQHAIEVCRELHDLIYDARQEKNAAAQQARLTLENTPPPTAAPPDIPLDDLERFLSLARNDYYAAKAQADTNANANAARAARIETLERQIAETKPPYTRDELQSHLDTTIASLQTLTIEIDRLRNELDRIQRLHTEAINNRAQAQTSLNDIRLLLQTHEQRDAQQAELDALKADAAQSGTGVSPVDLPSLAAQLDQTERDLNNRRAQDAYDRAHAAHTEAKRLSDLYTGLVTLFRDTLPKQLLAAANLPIPGLEIQPEHIAINGKPLHCLSNSEQIKVGVAIAATLAPACGFVLIDNGESLDPDNRQTLRQIADELNLQLILTLVDPDATPSESVTVIQKGQALEPVPSVPSVP